MKSSMLWTHMKAATKRFFPLAILLSILTVTPGCGGGTKLNNTENRQLTVEVDRSGARGALLENPPTRIGTLKTTHFTEQLQAAMPSLLAIAGTPKCDVDFHHFEYSTVGAATEQTTASGGLMVQSTVPLRSHVIQAHHSVRSTHGEELSIRRECQTSAVSIEK